MFERIKRNLELLRLVNESGGPVFAVHGCRMQVLEDGSLFICGTDGEPVAVSICDCVFDTRNMDVGSPSQFAGDYDIDRLMRSGSPIKILLPAKPGVKERRVDEELEDLL